MPRDRQEIGPCQECGEGVVACTYNHFADDEKRIDSWEHKCPSCGARQTRAFRSDEPDDDDPDDPTKCPFCGRQGNA